MNLFQQISLLFTWVPHIMRAVALIELVATPGMSGADKKATVLAELSVIANKMNLPWGDDAIGVISSIIDTAVRLMHFVGRFTKRPDDTTRDPEEVKVMTAAALVAPDPQVLDKNLHEVAASDEAFEKFLAGFSTQHSKG